MSIMETIRSDMQKELPVWDEPSIAVGIVKDGEVVMNEAFGYADIEKGLKADAETLYQIGSCSKAFTAAAAALLVDQGKLEWDRPVREYLPWLEFADAYTTAHVTLRDMLCHRTGLPRHDAYWIDGPVSRRGMAENLRNMQPGWAFRSHWCYQNTCFVAVGALIEAVSGQTWEQFLKENLLDPIGMTRTTFYVDAISADANHAQPYARLVPTARKGINRIGFLKSDCEDMEKGIGAPYGPAGSIMSTINDMNKWLLFNLNNGKVGDRQIISEANMKEIHKPNMLMDGPLLMPCKEMDFHSYGMGWFVETYRGHVMVEHGGNINGFTALVTMIPDQNLGIVNLVNFNNSVNTYASTNEIVDRYLGVEGGDWNVRYREFLGKLFDAEPGAMEAVNGKRIEGTTPAHPLEAYTGTYRNACYGDIVIAQKDDGLTFLYNKRESPAEHYHFDTFVIKDEHALFNGMGFKFNTGLKGNVETLQIAIALDPAVKDELFTKVEA